MLKISNKHYIPTILLLALTVLTVSAQDHQSYDNHTGNWEDASTWQIGNGNLSNNDIVNIYGFVKHNGDLTLNNGMDVQIYDTLVVLGDLFVNQTGEITVHTGGMILVFGNAILYNNVDVDLSSYFVVMGNFDQRNQSGITAPAGDTLLYVTGTSNCANQASCLPSDQVGGIDDLLDNNDLSDLVLTYTNQILPPNPVLCPGSSVELTIRSDGSNYQWYRNGTAISGANSYTYSATQTGDYDVSFNASGSSFSRTDSPDPVTVTSGGAARIYDIGSNSPVQLGNTVNLLLNPGADYPATSVASTIWTGPDGFTSSLEDPSFTATALSNTGDYTATVTTNQGCSTSGTTNVQVTTAPSACCTGSAYYSVDEQTGNWEDASSWGNANTGSTPIPPPTSPMNSQTLCINGLITLNGSLTLNGSQQKICDTLVITGDLLNANPTLTITSTGVLIVLGNMDMTTGSINNEGRVIFAGEFEAPYNLGGAGDYYVFDPTPTVPGWFSTTTYTEAELNANDNDLYNFFLSLTGGSFSGGTISASQTICSGDDVAVFTSTADAGPGSSITYQWYQSVDSNDPAAGSWTAISGATGNAYDHGTLSQTTSFYRMADNGGGSRAISNVLTITANSLPTVSVSSDDTDNVICDGEVVTLDAGAGFTSYSWSTGGSSQTEAITNSAPVVALQIVNATVTVTNINGCSATSSPIIINIYPQPRTGPGYRVEPDFGN